MLQTSQMKSYPSLCKQLPEMRMFQTIVCSYYKPSNNLYMIIMVLQKSSRWVSKSGYTNLGNSKEAGILMGGPLYYIC